MDTAVGFQLETWPVVRGSRALMRDGNAYLCHYRPLGTPQARPAASRVVARSGDVALSRARARDVVASEAADVNARVGAPAKSTGEPYA
jgi:hypothetical protein